MQFSFNPVRITKELLLSKNSEEEYMSFYLGIIPDDELHVNPLRRDNNPTATFYRARTGELIFKDWATGLHANFIDIVMEKYGVSFAKALSIIANDFGILNKGKTEKNQPMIKYDGAKIEQKQDTILQAEVKDFTEAELKWWKDQGVSQETLKKFNVYSVKSVFLDSKLIYGSSNNAPIYGYYFGKEDGRELWKMYFPTRTSYRFLLNTNKLQGVKQLPKTGDIVVVTKSLKDVMALYEMGIPAVAPQAESVIITARQYAALQKRFKTIIFNGDWDRAGQRFMIESRKKYKAICLSFTNKKKFGKDVSDFVKKVGFTKAKTYIDKVVQAVSQGRFNYQYRYCKSEV